MPARRALTQKAVNRLKNLTVKVILWESTFTHDDYKANHGGRSYGYRDRDVPSGIYRTMTISGCSLDRAVEEIARASAIPGRFGVIIPTGVPVGIDVERDFGVFTEKFQAWLKDNAPNWREDLFSYLSIESEGNVRDGYTYSRTIEPRSR
jgi:hypothetical protein